MDGRIINYRPVNKIRELECLEVDSETVWKALCFIDGVLSAKRRIILDRDDIGLLNFAHFLTHQEHSPYQELSCLCKRLGTVEVIIGNG